MKIRGREINFLRTVKTTSDISKLCPDGNIERVEELFAGTIADTLENGAKIIHFLNEGYEKNKKLDDPSYEPKIISVEEIMLLDEKTFEALLKSAFESFNVGAETTIELEDSKKKEMNQATD